MNELLMVKYLIYDLTILKVYYPQSINDYLMLV